MKVKIDQKYFEDIISKHLPKYKDNRWIIKNTEYNELNFVIEMCTDLSKIIPNSTLEDILKLDRYNAGQTDYHSKFALHCLELYNKNVFERGSL